MKYLWITLLVSLSYLPAVADSATFDINVSNNAISPPSASYGTIGLSLNSNGTITITANMSPGYLLGGGNGAPVLGFNFANGVNGSQVSLASALPSGYSFACCNPRQMNGFGSFATYLTGSSSSSSLATLTFTLSTTQVFTGQNTAGFTSVYQLIAFSSGSAGDGNQYFAVHVVPAGGGQTGYAGTTTLVPDHGRATLLLAAIACSGSLWFSRIRTPRSQHSV